METFFQQLINGISQGSAYALIALGYTMVYGVLRLINFAHGDVYMVGAFAGYYIANNDWVQANIGTSGWVAVVVMVGAMVVCAVLGILIERFAYRPGRGNSPYTMVFWLAIVGASVGRMVGGTTVALLGGVAAGAVLGFALERFGIRPARQSSHLTLLIIAIGVSLFLENGGQLAFGADPKFFPEIIPTRRIQLGGLTVDSQRLTVLGVAIALMVALTLIINYTKTGKAMRAVSYNLDAAKLMGIMPGLKAFVAAVLGGIGSIPGAMVGGLIIGLAEVMAVGYGQSTYRDAIAFVILVLILLLKPSGILGKKASEKV